MLTTIGRFVATGLVVALTVGIFAKIAPIGIGQMFLACVGWSLAYFGDELAPLVGVTSTSSSSRYVDPVIRTIGWLFLLSASGLFLARILRIW
jgi:hypothetical protein